MAKKETWAIQQLNEKEIIKMINLYNNSVIVEEFLAFVDSHEVAEGIDIAYLQIGLQSVYLAVYDEQLELTFSEHEIFEENGEEYEEWDNTDTIQFPQLDKDLVSIEELKDLMKKELNRYIKKRKGEKGNE